MSVPEQIREARKGLPAFLQSSEPEALASKLLPILSAPWPEACTKALDASTSGYDAPGTGFEKIPSRSVVSYRFYARYEYHLQAIQE